MVTVTNNSWNVPSSNSKDGSPRRLESFIAWEDDSFVAERRRSLRKKYQASTELLVIELDKTSPTIGKRKT